MIYPRLILAHELLSGSGVVFISIDDSSIAPLRLVMDEIFGIDNYVQTFLWLHGKGKKDKQSRTQHQYVLCYAKNRAVLPTWRQKVTKTYGKTINPDNDPRGPWFSGSVSFSEQRSNPEHSNYFTIESPSGIKWTRQWLCSREEMTVHLKNNQIYFGPTPEQRNVPRLKIFTHETEIIPLNVLDDLGTSRSAMRECADAFDGNHVFDYPKPVALIEHLLRLACPDGGRVLDFFAGSGTTGIASVRLSNECDVNYHCTLVQKPEVIDEKHFADRVSWCERVGIEANLSALCWYRLNNEKCHDGRWQRFICTSQD
jgi:adenine-specific DNA-methyltransferase